MMVDDRRLGDRRVAERRGDPEGRAEDHQMKDIKDRFGLMIDKLANAENDPVRALILNRLAAFTIGLDREVASVVADPAHARELVDGLARLPFVGDTRVESPAAETTFSVIDQAGRRV